ncbi:MAG: hypothetical protein RR646_02540 [Erysipelotrichaceae bacterium]|uniref:hypothetical protein n=1 Tax=Niameybacter sp. TaxID=2033640 RepID=UPI002FCB7DE7
MQELITQAFPIILTSLMGYLIFILKEDRKGKQALKQYNDNMSQALKILMRLKLIEYHDKYCEEGKIPSYALQNAIEMYDTYHALGGNGFVTELYKEITELPVRKKR